MEPPVQKQDSDKEKNPPDNSTPVIKGEHNQDDSTITTDKADNKKKDKFRFWRKANRTQKTQIILALLNFLTLLSFIVINGIQIRRSNEFLNYADSTNVHTRESIELAKRTADSSDINNKRLIALNENSLDLVKNNATTTEKFAKIEVRPYLNYSGEENHSFIPGLPIKIRLNFLNNGKTPAYDIRSRTVIKIGTGISPKEIKLLEMSNIKASDNKGIVVGAGQSYFIEATGSWILPDSNYIYKSSYTLYVYGETLYRDKFRENHYTHFSLFYRPNGNIFLHYPGFFDAD